MNQPSPVQPPSARKRLLDLLNDATGVERVNRLLEALGPETADGSGFVRAALIASGQPAPPETDASGLAEFLGRYGGWRFMPTFLYPRPNPGDLFITAGADLRPAGIGFVLKLPAEVQSGLASVEWVLAADVIPDGDGRFRRRQHIAPHEGEPGIMGWLLVPGG